MDQAIRLAPRNHIAQANRGLAYRGKGDDNRALADYSRAIEIDRKYVYAFIARSRLYRDRRDFDKAIQDAEAALRLAPKSAQAYRVRGSIYREKRDSDRALSDFAGQVSRARTRDG